MKCPNCGAQNSEEAVYCSNCGSRIDGACNVCGFKNEAGAVFCIKCGAKLTTNLKGFVVRIGSVVCRIIADKSKVMMNFEVPNTSAALNGVDIDSIKQSILEVLKNQSLNSNVTVDLTQVTKEIENKLSILQKIDEKFELLAQLKEKLDVLDEEIRALKEKGISSQKEVEIVTTTETVEEESIEEKLEKEIEESSLVSNNENLTDLVDLTEEELANLGLGETKNEPDKVEENIEESEEFVDLEKDEELSVLKQEKIDELVTQVKSKNEDVETAKKDIADNLDGLLKEVEKNTQLQEDKTDDLIKEVSDLNNKETNDDTQDLLKLLEETTKVEKKVEDKKLEEDLLNLLEVNAQDNKTQKDTNLLFILADKGDGVVKVFSPDRELLAEIGRNDAEKSYLEQPYKITYYSKKLYVTDFKLGKVKVFDDNLNYLFSYSDLEYPTAILIHDKKLYVLTGTDIKVFDPENPSLIEKINILDNFDLFPPDSMQILNNKFYLIGTDPVLTIMDMQGNVLEKKNLSINDKELKAPKGIKIYENLLWIADSENHRICVFKEDGTPIKWFGGFSPQREPGSLNNPTDLDILEEKVFVADSWNKRIAVFDLDGNFLENIEGETYFDDINDVKVIKKDEIRV